MKDIKVQDAIDGSWVDSLAPSKFRPFLRLSRMDRPVGNWLLFLPCMFGILVTGIIEPVSIWRLIHVTLVCLFGSILMRGAGCTWNDIVDREIDAKVARTKSRPLPSGQVTPRSAYIWMFGQMMIAGFALLTFSWPTIWLTLASLFIVLLYPFAKLVTYWPQFILGLAMNWGVLVVFQELSGHVSGPAIALYLAAVAWTIFYDTIYAFQDIDDDSIIGVKSSAQAIRKNPKLGLLAFEIATFFFLALVVFMTMKLGLALAFLIFIFVLELIRQGFHEEDPKKCLELFRKNVLAGQVLVLALFFVFCLSLI